MTVLILPMSVAPLASVASIRAKSAGLSRIAPLTRGTFTRGCVRRGIEFGAKDKLPKRAALARWTERARPDTRAMPRVKIIPTKIGLLGEKRPRDKDVRKTIGRWMESNWGERRR
jgi:hypothetical protein